MQAILLLAFAWQATTHPEPLPVDEQMAVFERAMPALRSRQAEIDADLDRLGPAEADWASSGMSVADAIENQGGGVKTHVLGEWERGGNSVYVPGDRPLPLPSGFRRYAVRVYDGPVDTHYYFRIAPGIVLHTFGAVERRQAAECRPRQGMELISRSPWQDWSWETSLLAFGLIKWTRDDHRSYCSLLRPVAGGLTMVAYTPDGRPYVVAHEVPEVWELTSRTDASARLFGTQPD